METLAGKDLADALRESEHRYRQLTESLPQLVWTCTPEGECDYLSPQWVAYTGIPEAVQLNLGWMEQIHPDDRTAIFTAWTDAVHTGQAFCFEARIRRFDGQYRWFEARATPLRNVESQIVKWFGASSDIHEARETRTALEQERERLAKLVALAPAVFCSFCLRPDGSAYFPYASPGIFELYGLNPDELKKDASHLFAIVHPADREGFHAAITSSAQTLSLWSSAFRILHLDKGERWIGGQATPNVEADGSIVWHGFLTDMTERKQVESEQTFLLDLGIALQLATSPETIAATATQRVGDRFNASRCSLSAINMPDNEAMLLHEYSKQGDSATPGGRCPLTMWGSAQWIQSLASGTAIAVGDTASDPITAPFYADAFRPLDIRALVAVPLRRAGEWVAVLSLAVAEQREWVQREIDSARAAAEKIWPAYESACARVAERVMHQTLAASEERLNLALQSAAIGIWEQNPDTGEILWDARCKEIFGFPDSKLDLAAAIACIHPEDRERVMDNARSYVDPAGSGHFDMEFRIHAWNDGTLRHIYDKGQTFFEGEGATRRAVRSIGTLQNITALKENERALRLANEDLEEFAYVASHDLKAPLRVIDNAAMWLEEDLAEHLTAETRDHMNLLRGRVKRMDKLLEDLLEYARIGRKTDEQFAETIAGDALIDNILGLLSPAGFAIVVSPGFAAVEVQRMPLQQILMNLMSNAIKHHDKKTGRIEVTVEDGGAHFVFAVKDDGPGIPAQFQDQIFEMFQTLRPRDQVEGSGMGLALVRKNIEVFGGTLDLKSSEGQGSVFRFTWPKQQKMRKQTPHEIRAPVAGEEDGGRMTMLAIHNSKPLNILLVEDDDGDAKALERAFQKAKIANPMRRAVDGLEALDILNGVNGQPKLPRPNILLVDLNMPRMNGIQLVEAIRADEDLRQSIVFILTTSKRDEDKTAVYDLNVAGYIVKATAGQDFLNLVGLMDCYWRIVEMP